MKEQIMAALTAAGVSVEGLSDAQVLAAYNSLNAKPLQEKLAAANAKVAEFEQAEQAKLQAEVNQLAEKLATNSSLTADDFKQMKVERLRELASNAQAAPIMLGNQSSGEKSTYVLPD
jgi:alcohol dehydrogenase class IV